MNSNSNTNNEVKSSKFLRKSKTKKFEEYTQMMKELKTLNQVKLLIQIEEYLSIKSKFDIHNVDNLIHFNPFEKLLSIYLKYINLSTDSKQYISIFNNREISELVQQNKNSKLFLFTKECYI